MDWADRWSQPRSRKARGHRAAALFIALDLAGAVAMWAVTLA